MDEAIKENFENQLIYLYDEKQLFENQIGTSDPKLIVEEYKKLEAELKDLYSIKEHYTMFPASEVKLTRIKSVLIESSRLKGSK